MIIVLIVTLAWKMICNAQTIYVLPWHLTPASSSWLQFSTPGPEWGQESRRGSEPLHDTLSNNIELLPSPKYDEWSATAPAIKYNY